MNKILGLIILLVAGITAQAQDIYGEATYFSKAAIDKSFLEGNRDINPEQRKRIEENLKKASEKTFVLKFNRSESVWIEEVALAAPSQGRGGWGNFMGSAMGGEKYKDITSNTFTEQRDMMGKTFLIKDDLPVLDWQITGETRQIGNYTAIKATAVKKNDALDMSAFRRRRGNDNEKKKEEDGETSLTDMIEKDENTTVTAWFTPQIPVQHGPAEYGGLPGLILELNANNTTMLCTKIALNPDSRSDIEPATKGEEIKLEEYNTTFQQKMEEMAQRFRGRGGRGRN
ncbi:GLPGLI family protein [Nonlabens sp. Hel1_33_55]|uniref:GLPGLI family protein n=1 Tax=Nonlabens sp. Hel1_33_55 TaxID=1336802 RepID=UPI000875B20E|nr:GLPGLI family protein [Nonlabens sp. Hel1_33_55]SCY27144.1 GLPGLI family protein [Nonlabens sp. Hel1_33_55]